VIEIGATRGPALRRVLGAALAGALALLACDLPPSFSADGRHVLFQRVATKHRDDGAALAMLDLESGAVREIRPIGDDGEPLPHLAYQIYQGRFAENDRAIYALAAARDAPKSRALRLAPDGKVLSSVAFAAGETMQLAPVAVLGRRFLCVAEGAKEEPTSDASFDSLFEFAIDLVDIDFERGTASRRKIEADAVAMTSSRSGLFILYRRGEESPESHEVVRLEPGAGDDPVRTTLFTVPRSNETGELPRFFAGESHFAFLLVPVGEAKTARTPILRITDEHGHVVIELEREDEKWFAIGAFGHEDRTFWLAVEDGLLRYDLATGERRRVTLHELGVPAEGHPQVAGIALAPNAPRLAIQLGATDRSGIDVAYDLIVLDESNGEDDLTVVARVRAPR
jgi:hypothetical protein